MTTQLLSPRRLWQRYIMLMVLDGAQYGNAVSMDDLLDGASPEEGMQIRLAMNELLEMKWLAETGEELYELTTRGRRSWG